tara:strand:- start:113 stop:457 length:345 start_codon:yes stop_codon:yes gene_type:complete
MAKKADKKEVKKATKKVVKKAKKATKKVVKKVLDSTELDEKIIAEYKENKTIIDSILCYINCYGAYVLAVGAGCTFGVNNWVALGLLAITSGWAYWNRACKNNKFTCCGNTCKK